MTSHRDPRKIGTALDEQTVRGLLSTSRIPRPVREGRARPGRAVRLRAWALTLAATMAGFLGGSLLAARPGSPTVRVLLPFLGAALGGGVAGWVLWRRARAAGAASPFRAAPGREYALVEALVAEGRYEQAVAFFELAAAENPRDPTPCVRAARVLGDHLGRHEEALRWLRRARDGAATEESHRRALTREVAELLLGPLGSPARAAPELARLAETAAGTPEGEWAAGELARVKALMRGA